jgi:hypothetical protein
MKVAAMMPTMTNTIVGLGKLVRLSGGVTGGSMAKLDAQLRGKSFVGERLRTAFELHCLSASCREYVAKTLPRLRLYDRPAGPPLQIHLIIR